MNKNTSARFSIIESLCQYHKGSFLAEGTDDADFEIRNGVLTKYRGKGGVVTVPDTVKVIGKNVFANCYNLSVITLPDTLTEIDDNAFEFCTGLRSIALPKKLKRIGKEAFFGCDSLNEVELPNSLSTLDDSAFLGCESLYDVIIPKNLKKISKSVFLGTAFSERPSPDYEKLVGSGIIV